MENYYKTLGVDRNSSIDEIKKAYYKQLKKYHPDVYNGDDAQEKTAYLNKIYSTLKSSSLRHQYDLSVFGDVEKENNKSNFDKNTNFKKNTNYDNNSNTNINTNSKSNTNYNKKVKKQTQKEHKSLNFRNNLLKFLKSENGKLIISIASILIVIALIIIIMLCV